MSRFAKAKPQLSPVEIGKTLYARAFDGADRSSLRDSMQDFQELSAPDKMFILCHLQYLTLQAQAQTHALLLGIRDTAEDVAGATIAIADAVTQPPDESWGTPQPADGWDEHGMSLEPLSSPRPEVGMSSEAQPMNKRPAFLAGIADPETSAAGTSAAGTSDARLVGADALNVASPTLDSPSAERENTATSASAASLGASLGAASAAPTGAEKARRRGRERAAAAPKEGDAHAP